MNWLLGSALAEQCAFNVTIRAKYRRGLSQALFPLGDLPVCRTARGPPALPAREVRKLKRWFGQLHWLTGCKSGIELRDLLHEDSHRPPVDDDIVQDQKQNIVVGAEPQETRPQQRCTLHVEGCQGFFLGFQLRLFEQECIGPSMSGRRQNCKIFDNEE